jgi:transcriptional regulator with XRE-family HTH domain
MTGEELKERRQSLGLTGRKLANLLRTSEHHIYYWESGKEMISPATESEFEQIEARLKTASHMKPIKFN